SLAAPAMPRPMRLRVAMRLADVASRRLPAERAVVRRNLTRILPGTPPRALDELVGAVFRNFAVCFADLITANRRAGVGALVAAIDGTAELQKAVRAGRGLVVLTAHLGNWELAGRMLARDGARPTHVVVAAEADPAVERFLRGGAGPVRFVTPTAPTVSLSLVAALRRGEIVALQGDRGLGTRGDVLLPFFGAPAPFPLGPVVLARDQEAAHAPARPPAALPRVRPAVAGRRRPARARRADRGSRARRRRRRHRARRRRGGRARARRGWRAGGGRGAVRQPRACAGRAPGRPRPRADRVHRVRIGRHGAGGGRRSARRERRRSRRGRRLRRALSLRDAGLRRAALAHARARAAVRPAAQRAAAGRGRRPRAARARRRRAARAARPPARLREQQ